MKDFFTFKNLRKWFFNKYTITLYLFTIIYVFVGDQSLIKRISKATEIRKINKEKELITKQIEQAETMLKSLDNKDSLERYAREVYIMHEDGEEVYLID